MPEKVLFIDDDENLLAAFRRSLRDLFEVTTAAGGTEGLDSLRNEGPFAVVVADMRMPGMDGIQFLSKARDIAPESVRMMLTGNADLDTAVNAVNEGHIFRFLTKPCPHEVLVKTVHAGVQQYRLIIAERQLLEETLNGGIKVMAEILSLVNPKAFGRASRVRRYVHQIAETMGLPNRWQYDVAAMLSQIGCLTLPTEMVEKVFAGAELLPEEAQAYGQHPDVGGRLIVNIPRLEDVAHMIARQQEPFSWDRTGTTPSQREPSALGGHILKVAIDFDQMLSLGVKANMALAKLRADPNTYDPQIVRALTSLHLDPDDICRRAVRVDQLGPEMVFDQDVRAKNGTLLVTKGQDVTEPILEHLRRWNDGVGIEEPISVLIFQHNEAPVDS